MASYKKNLVIVTPVKNEEKNLNKLYESVTMNSRKPDYWVIINNESTDNSSLIIEKFIEKNNIKIIHLKYSDIVSEYKLGFKYSRIVNFGFEYVMKNLNYDYVGILDADVFPEFNYFEEILKLLENEPTIGISSGICFDFNGKYDGERKSAVRGNCRIWTAKCFNDAGYIIGPSADTLSLGLAEIKGYKPVALDNIKCEIRPMGEKSKWKYYGFSACYRGVPIPIACIKFFRVSYHNGLRNAFDYIFGYFENLFFKREKLKNKELTEYFKKISYKRILSFIMK